MDVFFGVELERVLDPLDWRSGARMLRRAVFMNGYVVFGPVDEILAKARVL